MSWGQDRLARIRLLAEDGDDLCKHTGVDGSYTVTDQDVLWLLDLLAAADEVVVEVQLSGRPFHEHPDPHALADCRMCRKVVRYRELKEGER